MQNRLDNTRRWLNIGLVLLALLWLLCIWFSVNKIQADLQNRGQEALRMAGLNEDYLSVNGCDVNLDGKVDSELIKGQYTSALSDLKGIRQASFLNSSNGLHNKLLIEEAIVDPPEVVEPEVIEAVVLGEPYLDITMKDGKAILNCSVSASERLSILKAAEQLYGAENVVDNCVAADDLKEATWLNGMLGLLPKFDTDLEGARLTAQDNAFTIAGIADNDEQRLALASLADNAVGLDLQNNIEIKAIELIEPDFQFTASDGLELSGNVSQATADAVQKSLLDSADCALYSRIDNNINVGENYLSPIWTADVFSNACNATVDSPDFAMSYAGKKLTLRGTVDSQAKRAAIANSFIKSADGIEIINNIEVVLPVVLKDPSFKWLRTNDKLEIIGNVAEATSIYADSAATCAVDSDNIDNRLNISENYKQLPWAQKVFNEACRAAQESPDFAIAYIENKLTLTGTVDSEAKRLAIAEKFAGSADGVQLVNNIVVLKPVESIEIPTPDVSSEVEAPTAVVPEVTAVLDIPEVATPEIVLDVPEVTEPEEVVPEVTEPEVDVPEVAVAEVAVPEVVKLRAPSLRVDVSSQQVRVNGFVGTEVGQRNAGLGFTNKEVDNQVVLEADIENPDYLNEVIKLGPEVAKELDRVTLSLENEKLTILGVAATEEQRSAVGNFVQSRLEPDVTVVNKLTVKSTIPFTEDGK